MAKREYSKYQQKAIKNYYENLDTIKLTRLQELVTELYLADTKAKKDRLWGQVEKAMGQIGVKPSVAEHIMTKRDVTLLAKNLQEWLKTAK